VGLQGSGHGFAGVIAAETRGAANAHKAGLGGGAASTDAGGHARDVTRQSSRRSRMSPSPHFASVRDLPETRPRRVVIVDPKVCEQMTNYRAIFGKVEPIGQCAERVDWDSLLGR
jgi:hypothetical protein